MKFFPLQIEKKVDSVSVASDRYSFRLSTRDASCEITSGNFRKLKCPVIPGLPVFRDSYEIRILKFSVSRKNTSAIVHLTISTSSGDIGEIRGQIECEPEKISIKTYYTAMREHFLCGWQVLPKDTHHNYSSVENLWNRPDSPENLLSYDTSEPVETTTGGANRIWAPHVSALILRNQDDGLLLGIPELSPAFSLHYRSLPVTNGATGEAILDCGSGNNGYAESEGNEVTSPMLLLEFYRNRSGEDIYADFYRRFKNRERSSGLSEFWFRPWYCTWADQYSFAMSRKLGHPGCLAQLNEGFVRNVLNLIREKELPVGAIIIDDGWQTFRGDWDADKRKFPDMRRVTDRLHEAGLKAMLWWAPFCYDPQSALLSRDWMFCIGQDAYGRKMLDYSLLRVQNEYLLPLLEKFFSSAPGGWNFDGIKIDFLADRNHPGARTHDPRWHGQEFYLIHLYRLIHDTAARFKKDICIYGTAQHPAFEKYQNLIGLEENFSDAGIYVRNRCNLQKKLMPSTPVGAHFNYYCHTMKEFMRQCIEGGAIPQIPPLLQSLDGFIPDENYFSELRLMINEWLSRCGPQRTIPPV